MKIIVAPTLHFRFVMPCQYGGDDSKIRGDYYKIKVLQFSGILVIIIHVERWKFYII